MVKKRQIQTFQHSMKCLDRDRAWPRHRDYKHVGCTCACHESHANRAIRGRP